jgi:putative ABC transport system permease protein
VHPWRQIMRGLRALIRRADADRDLRDEVQHYVDESARAHRARGLSPAEALRAARLEVGNPTVFAEEVRDYGWENAVDTAVMDLRYAARRLRATPAFTIVTAITLALGIGATTAIWSAVNAVLFRPLPYPRAERIIGIADRSADGGRADVTFGTFTELAARAHTLSAIAVMKPWQPTAANTGEPERLEGQYVSAGYLGVFGVAPARGRDFAATDDRASAARVVILSDALWKRRFGADPAIIGRSIRLDDDAYTVVGVMPPGFVAATAPSAVLWTPLQYDMSQGRAWGHHLQMIARVRPPFGLDDAAREIDAIARAPVSEFPRQPWASLERGLILGSLQDELTRGVRPALLAILGAVGLVLLIVCVNVANLLLARGVQRRGELAVRTALGAGRGRLVRQLLTESLLISLAGGAAGLVVAAVATRAIVRLRPPELPSVASLRIDGAAFAFALAITAAVGVAIGCVPALQAIRADPKDGLGAASRRSTGGHRRTRGALVVAEVALALLLLVSSGLLLRSIERLFAVRSGFDASNVLTMQVQTSGHRFDRDDETARFFAAALDAVRRVPGVTSAALTSQLPLSGDADRYGLRFDPAPAGDPGEVDGTFRYGVSPGYFETMRIPLRRGRFLDERDVANAPAVAVISESVARRRLGTLDPLGRRIRIGDGPSYTIVGVVGDVKQMSLAAPTAEAVYTTTSQWRFADNPMSVVIRARGYAPLLTTPAREAIWSVDKGQPIVRVATMESLVAASGASRRFALTLFGAFAIAALVLAAAGIYGILAGGVVERSREIGVRAALGATRGRIVGLVLRDGLRLTAVGVVLGVAGAVAATRALASLLFGVSPLDPLTFASVIVVLGAAAAIACAIPAWRAARVDPVIALRGD